MHASPYVRAPVRGSVRLTTPPVVPPTSTRGRPAPHPCPYHHFHDGHPCRMRYDRSARSPSPQPVRPPCPQVRVTKTTPMLMDWLRDRTDMDYLSPCPLNLAPGRKRSPASVTRQGGGAWAWVTSPAKKVYKGC